MSVLAALLLLTLVQGLALPPRATPTERDDNSILTLAGGTAAGASFDGAPVALRKRANAAQKS